MQNYKKSYIKIRSHELVINPSCIFNILKGHYFSLPNYDCGLIKTCCRIIAAAAPVFQYGEIYIYIFFVCLACHAEKKEEKY